MSLKRFITPDQMLGPIRHEVFVDDLESSAVLTSNVEPFEKVFTEHSRMIIGRKGSGKTSVIKGYRSLTKYGRAYGKIDRDEANNGDLNIPIVEWNQFNDLIRKVFAQTTKEAIRLGGEDMVPPERVAEVWTETIWDLIFQNLYDRGMHSQKCKNELGSIIRLFNEEDVFEVDKNKNATIDKIYKKAIEEATNYFSARNIKCFILIDSMDDYPIRSKKFSKVVSGFLKCINDFSYYHDAVRIVYCLPAEIMEYVRRFSSNSLKDFGASAELKWKPADLLRIVAERFRVGLFTLSSEVDSEYEKKLKAYEFENRDDLQEFFSETLEHELENSLGRKEDTLAYLLRHTQLLPREFIFIFNLAIKLSKEEKGSWRFISANAIKTAVENSETELARHILHPFQNLYPDLLQACESVLPELPPICTKRDLDKLGSRFKNRIEDDIYNPWKTLFDMGVLGYVEDSSLSKGQEHDRYAYGYFNFNSTSPIAFQNDALYCVHPLFSRLWSMKRDYAIDARSVYPANIQHFRARL